MKTILITPLMLFWLLSAAQEQPKYKSYYAPGNKMYGITEAGDTVLIEDTTPKAKVKVPKTPGTYLNRAGNLLITGLCIGVGASMLSGIGAAKGNSALVYSGIGINAGAFFLTIAGYAQIKRSGRKLNALKIGTP